MRILRFFLPVVAVLGVLALADEGQAVIYKYLNEKGEPVYVDDMTKVPEPVREKVIIVTGQEEQELVDDAERVRALSARGTVAGPQDDSQKTTESFRRRMARSGAAAAAVIAVLFVMMNIDALKERTTIVRNTRIALISFLVLFIGFTHATDVIKLFRSAGDAVPSPVADIKEKQAERGRQAAESYKNLNRSMQENVQREVDRVQKQFDEAERGR